MKPDTFDNLYLFLQEYTKAKMAMQEMSRLWEDAQTADHIELVVKLPEYMPSFDEFVADFGKITSATLLSVVINDSGTQVATKALAIEGIGIMDRNGNYFPAGVSTTGKGIVCASEVDEQDRIYTLDGDGFVPGYKLGDEVR